MKGHSLSTRIRLQARVAEKRLNSVLADDPGDRRCWTAHSLIASAKPCFWIKNSSAGTPTEVATRSFAG
jgi:hypothetical protein